MRSLPRLGLIVLLLLPVAVAAQEGPPAEPPGGGPARHEPPRPGGDVSFFLGQAMRAMNEKADVLLEEKKTEEAITELRRVFSIEVAKDDPVYELKARLIGRLAGLYASAGRKGEALATIKGLLADVPSGSPAEAAAWLDAGTAYRTLGMPGEALKAFDHAIELSTTLAKRPRPRNGPPPGRREPLPGEPPPPGEQPPSRPPGQ